MIKLACLLCGTYAECVATDLTSDFHKRTQRGMRLCAAQGAHRTSNMGEKALSIVF